MFHVELLDTLYALSVLVLKCVWYTYVVQVIMLRCDMLWSVLISRCSACTEVCVLWNADDMFCVQYSLYGLHA